MKKIAHLGYLLSVLVLAGCAHPITITPNLSTIDRKDVTPIEKNAGYFISQSDREKKVVTPGGGGDKVEYMPYRDIEAALQKVLSNLFVRVYKVPSPGDTKFIADNDISFIFVPKVETRSSSTGVMTWMATDFTLVLDCKAIDRNGAVVWEQSITGNGHAEFNEMMETGDYQLSSRRASEAVFLSLQEQLNSNLVFR